VLDVVDQVTASQVSFTPTGGIAATDVQAALAEVDSEKVAFTRLDDSDGSSLVGFLQAGTGAVARTVQGKLRDVVSVFDFMTSAQIADVQSNAYSVDVSGAVQAAIDANATNGAYLWFPKGTYRFDSGVTLPVNATAKWVFDAPSGTTIRTSNAITLISRNPVDQTSALNTIQDNTLAIKNMVFRGSQISGQVGLDIGSIYGALFDNCSFLGLDRASIFRFCLKTVVRNCFYTNNVTESIVLTYGNWSGASTSNSQSNSSTVQSCRIFNRAGATSSISVLAASDVSIRDCVIEGANPVYGVYFDSLGATVVKNIIIDGCHLECTPTASAFYLKGTGGLATIRGLFAQGTLPAGAYLIDNSDFSGTNMAVHLVDTAFLPGPNPAGYLVKTAYPGSWYINADNGLFVSGGVILKSRFESVNAPLFPPVLVLGNNSSGGPSLGLRAAGNTPLEIRASDGSLGLTAGNQIIFSTANAVSINGNVCPQSTSFTTADGKTVTVRHGFITSVV